MKQKKTGPKNFVTQSLVTKKQLFVTKFGR